MCISKRGLSSVFGVPGPSSKLAGFQCRPPSYTDSIREARTVIALLNIENNLS